jgi:sporulation protein YlmC with PRC-barrel domain
MGQVSQYRASGQATQTPLSRLGLMKQVCSGLVSSSVFSVNLPTPNGLVMAGLKKLGGILGLGLVLSVTATAQDASWTIETARLGLMKQTSTLIGRKCIDRNGKSVGKIREVLFDLRTGELLVTLIAAPKSQLIPVPATSYTFASRDHLVIGTEWKTFKTAPRIPKTSVAFGLDANSLAPAYQFFGRALTPCADGSARVLCTGTSLLGMQLLSPERELLGKVKDIEVDLLHGRIVYLVIEPAPGVASPGELIALPPVLAQPDPASRALVLASGRALFQAGPRFTKTFWTDMVFPEMAVKICNHYGLQTAVASKIELAGSTAENRQNLAPQQRSDDQITQAVIDEFIHRSSGFVHLEVSVTTHNGRVTLSGRVKDQKLKAELLTAAEHVVGAGNVEDQIDAPGKKFAQL